MTDDLHWRNVYDVIIYNFALQDSDTHPKLLSYTHRGNSENFRLHATHSVHAVCPITPQKITFSKPGIYCIYLFSALFTAVVQFPHPKMNLFMYSYNIQQVLSQTALLIQQSG